MGLKEEIVGLYMKATTGMSPDILGALKKAAKKEKGRARDVLNIMLRNIELAKTHAMPKCQDTGTPIFFVKGKDHSKIKKAITKATKIATREAMLRPNAVEPVTGKNVGNIPAIHFEQAYKLGITLMLKGGGSENISQFYSLPDQKLGAERNLEGVRRCVLDAVVKAQGKGCPPYIVGVGIGGSVDEVMALAKKQLLRKLDDKNSNKTLAKLEKELLRDINKLGIGPMGVGGKTTAIGVKIGAMHRHPACFFVGVSFGCWTIGRQTL